MTPEQYIINHATLKEGLAAFYGLNEYSDGSGAVTRRDAHGVNDLLDTNTTPSGTATIGKGADFSTASSEKLSITNANQDGKLDITGDITIGARIKLASLPSVTGRMGIVGKYLSTGNQRGYALVLESNDKLRLYAFQNGTTTNSYILETSAAAVVSGDVGNEIDIVVTLDISGTTGVCYINGTSVSITNAGTGSITGIYNNTADFAVGTYNGASYFDGVISYVGLWTRVLSQSEVDDLGLGMDYGIDIDREGAVVVGTGAATETISHTCTGEDRLLVVHCLTNNASNPITGVTYNGVAMTKSTTFTRSGEAFPVDTYTLVDPDEGTHDIVLTASGAPAFVTAPVSYTGVNQTTPIPATATATGNSALITDDLLTVSPYSWIFAGTRTGGAEPATGTNYVKRVSNGSNGVHAGDSDGALIPPFSHTVDAAITSGQWGISLLEIAAVAPTTFVDVKAWGGGGGGAWRNNKFSMGGGGAGGYVHEPVKGVAAGDYPVKVGEGGGGAYSSSNGVGGAGYADGGNGEYVSTLHGGAGGGSSAFGDDIIAAGGGGGGGNGGSGGGWAPVGKEGGQGYNANIDGGGGGAATDGKDGAGSPSGGPGQGATEVTHASGDGGNSHGSGGHGGGGGAAGVSGEGSDGAQATGSTGGDGGDGSGGAAGGAANGGAGAAGGLDEGGGGGAGAYTGTGGDGAVPGGGGGAGSSSTAGDGANGKVVIRYATDGSDGVSTDSTGGTVTTDGDDTIHTFTADGTFTAVLASAEEANISPFIMFP